ncbi:hypothetical protein ACSTHZ_23495, partial [Vibrio parahaemolyticus]
MPKYIEQNCKYCGNSFKALAKEVKRGNLNFCSKTCGYNSRKIIRQPNLSCALCAKPFYREISKQKSKSGFYF